MNKILLNLDALALALIVSCGLIFVVGTVKADSTERSLRARIADLEEQVERLEEVTACLLEETGSSCP